MLEMNSPIDQASVIVQVKLIDRLRDGKNEIITEEGREFDYRVSVPVSTYERWLVVMQYYHEVQAEMRKLIADSGIAFDNKVDGLIIDARLTIIQGPRPDRKNLNSLQDNGDILSE